MRLNPCQKGVGYCTNTKATCVAESSAGTVGTLTNKLLLICAHYYRAVSRLIKTLGARLTCGKNVHKAME